LPFTIEYFLIHPELYIFITIKFVSYLPSKRPGSLSYHSQLLHSPQPRKLVCILFLWIGYSGYFILMELYNMVLCGWMFHLQPLFMFQLWSRHIFSFLLGVYSWDLW
jgi:hypothetical protein